MGWPVIDRKQPPPDAGDGPVLSEAVREKIRSFFPRYPVKRAALLPALHVVQDAVGHISRQAMLEIAEVLEIPPAAVFDTATFYTHFWLQPRGKKVVTLCRSISCQLMGSDEVLKAFKEHLGIDEHATTPDGRYSLATEECLATCDFSPCALINEKLHKNLKPQDVPRILADPDNDKLAVPRSELYDAPG